MARHAADTVIAFEEDHEGKEKDDNDNDHPPQDSEELRHGSHINTRSARCTNPRYAVTVYRDTDQ